VQEIVSSGTFATLKPRPRRPLNHQPANSTIASSWFDPFAARQLPLTYVPGLVEDAVMDSKSSLGSISGSDSWISAESTFSQQLRLRALRRGYALVTRQNTSFMMLEPIFRHCLPVKSQTQIVHRLEYLMQCLGEDCLELDRRLRQRTPESFAIGNDESQMSAGFLGAYATQLYAPENNKNQDRPRRSLQFVIDTSETPGVTPSSVENYLAAQDVYQYLETEGLLIDTRSGYVEYTYSGDNLEQVTLERLCESRTLQPLEASNLADDIVGLARLAVCLNEGPVFRKADLDGILQAMATVSI
jgi:hypothetical protein